MQAIDEYERNGIHNDIPLAFGEIIKENGLEENAKDMNVIEFIKKYNLTGEYKRYVSGHLASRLIFDMIDYFYKPLTYFENRKFGRLPLERC